MSVFLCNPLESVFLCFSLISLRHFKQGTLTEPLLPFPESLESVPLSVEGEDSLEELELPLNPANLEEMSCVCVCVWVSE